jgi:intraflagellar transport protein 122
MNNAINENRFNDASYYCWILSMQCLDLAKDSTADQQNIHLKRYRDLSKKADIYYAYHNIHRYIVSFANRVSRTFNQIQ